MLYLLRTFFDYVSLPGKRASEHFLLRFVLWVQNIYDCPFYDFEMFEKKGKKVDHTMSRDHVCETRSPMFVIGLEMTACESRDTLHQCKARLPLLCMLLKERMLWQERG